jgi:hypothetical protein
MRTACLLAVVAAGSAWAVGFVGVPGSSAQYPTEITVDHGGKQVKMNLTGTAMRTKIILNVYAIGSYLQDGVKVKSAEGLAAADCLKRLHLVVERNIDGPALAEAFRSAIRLNHPEPEFKDEVGALVQFMRSTSVRKGEEILLTHVPGVGVHCSVAGKADFLVRNVAFARAMWEIYVGKNNLGDAIKKGLTSRL